MRALTTTMRVKPAAVAVSVLAAVLVAIPPADSQVATDGPPVIGVGIPLIGPTQGSYAFRIYGQGFQGVESVTIGGVAAPDVRVVDSELLTVTVPPSPGGANNATFDLVVTDNEGSDALVNSGVFGEQQGFFYTDATFTVTPTTGLAPGDTIEIAVSGYLPGAGVLAAEVHPTVNFIEKAPPYAIGPPAQVQPITGFSNVDANGNFQALAGLANPFLPGATNYDPNIVCPPNQETADFGLPDCAIAFTQLGRGTLERSIQFVDNLEPSPPSLTLSTPTASTGDAVTISGGNWNAAATFGSDSTPDDPGETLVNVEICDAGLASCRPAPADVEVEMTRYRDTTPNVTPEGEACRPSTTPTPGCVLDAEFSGATLSGTLDVGASSHCAPDCVVRVRQQRFDPELRGGVDSFIEATSPLTITSGSTSSTSTSSTSTSSTSTSSTSTSSTSTSSTSTSSTSTSTSTSSTSTSTTIQGGSTSSSLPSTTSTTARRPGRGCDSPAGPLSRVVRALADALGLSSLERIARLLCRLGL